MLKLVVLKNVEVIFLILDVFYLFNNWLKLDVLLNVESKFFIFLVFYLFKFLIFFFFKLVNVLVSELIFKGRCLGILIVFLGIVIVIIIFFDLFLK